MNQNDTFKVVPNFKNRTVSICDNIPDGAKRFTMMFNESRPVIQELLNLQEAITRIDKHPLFNLTRIENALKAVGGLPGSAGEHLQTMVAWYHHAMLLILDLHTLNPDSDEYREKLAVLRQLAMAHAHNVFDPAPDGLLSQPPLHNPPGQDQPSNQTEPQS